MSSRLSTTVLRVVILAAVVIILVVQVLLLPWLSGQVAADLPDEAYMRWPILTLAVLGLLCVQVALVCTERLLSFVRREAVFTASALPWVNGIIAAFLAGGVVCLATLGYQELTVSGPPLWSFVLLAGVVGGIGLAMLMWVMRTLLEQAIEMSAEIDVVI